MDTTERVSTPFGPKVTTDDLYRAIDLMKLHPEYHTFAIEPVDYGAEAMVLVGTRPMTKDEEAFHKENQLVRKMGF